MVRRVARRLDTFDRSTEALRLYEQEGFSRISTYYEDALDVVGYLERPL